ncbi:ATP-binding cassette domain-containing protein [Lederbergia citrea]|uniref:ATP-binding cassette domain-containing protein n=1 Tax=Lederbergia citrea TaxID=2833581 RepID=UPI001BC9C025|nr:ABC transporter ATP-binding protein [Lederbergia citrea]MBS4176748.1 ABC transporter ATP-binding protein [Lederbergia citrea]MBS4203309.1 ABC transporter ATP-binding protein [Lederbergia citrea]
MGEKLLQVNKLTVDIKGEKAVDEASFSVNKGEITCIIGQSGSGKSMSINALLGILPPTATSMGEAYFSGMNLLAMSEKKLQQVRGTKIFTIFQDAANSFNPSIKMKHQLYQLTGKKLGHSFPVFRKKIHEILRDLQFTEPQAITEHYPFQLSGGMLQRCMVACALYTEPILLIADEPTSALDMILQKELIEMLINMNQNTRTSILLVTHDLGVAAEAADELIVMLEGKVIETGNTLTIFDHPNHPYTKKLLEGRLLTC